MYNCLNTTNYLLLKLAVIAGIKLVLKRSVLHLINVKLELFLKSSSCDSSRSGGKRWLR